MTALERNLGVTPLSSQPELGQSSKGPALCWIISTNIEKTAKASSSPFAHPALWSMSEIEGKVQELIRSDAVRVSVSFCLTVLAMFI